MAQTSTIESPTETSADDNTLPEQRVLLDVRNGGRGVVHVVERRTLPASAHPGRWTRRAAHRRSLCGSLSAVLIGIDATDWPTESQAVDLKHVTCKRCRERAERLFHPAESGATRG